MRSPFQILPHSLFFISGLLLLVLLGAACHSSSPQSRPLTEQELRGRDVFFNNCAICHNAYKNEPLQGPPLVGVFRKQDLPSGMPATNQHVHDTILFGRRNMPSFNGILDEQQISEVIAFLHTL